MENIGLMDKVKEFVQLMKPRIIVLLATTGVIPYLLAGGNGLVNSIVFIVIGFMSAGGAMALNSVIDKDIDVLMERTKNRASVKGLFSDRQIVGMAVILMALAVVSAYFVFNWLAAAFVAYGALFYILGYSLYLKRKNVLNTLIGGLASPAPVLVGYAAALGEIPEFGWFVALLVFIWTPSHTWAMSAYYVDDYTKAGVPMLPVVYGLDLTAKATFVFMLITSAYSGWLMWIDGYSLLKYGLWGTTNLWFIWQGFKFLKAKTREVGYRTFKVHNYWLALQFLLLFL